MAFIKGLLFVLFSLFTTFLVADYIISKLDREELIVNYYDSKYIYSFYPDKTATQISTEYKSDVHIDSSALKNCHTNLQKKHKAQLWLLGNYFSEGIGVQCNKSFPFMVKQVNMFNGGFHKGSLPHYILKNRDYMQAIKPNIMIIQVSDYDIYSSVHALSFVYIKKNGEVMDLKNSIFLMNFFKKRIKEKSTYRTLVRAWSFFNEDYKIINYYKTSRVPTIQVMNSTESFEVYGRFKYIGDLENYKNGSLGFYKLKNLSSLSQDTQWKQQFVQFEILLKQLIQESREISPYTKIYLLYIPVKENFAKGGITGKIRNESEDIVYPSLKQIYASNLFYQFLTRFSKIFNISLINTTSLFHQNARDYYYYKSPYLNEKGHKKIANMINKTLKNDK